MNEVFKTGAVFDLVNNFSPELAKVIGGLEKFDKAVQGSQAELKKFGFGNLAARTDKQLDALVQATSLAVDKMIGHFSRVDKAINGTLGGVGRLGSAISGDLDAAAKAGADGVIGNLANVDKALTGSMGEVAKLAGTLSGDLTTAASTASAELVAGFGRTDASIATAVASAAALKTEIGLAAVAASGIRIPSLPGTGGGSGPGAGMGPRATRGNHSGGGGGGHGGFHFRAPGMHIPGGGHVGISEGSSGMAPAIGALAAGETIAKAIEHAFDFDHWVAILKANGMSDDRIGAAKQAAWANAGANPNASATESLKTIIELNKVTGNLEESMRLLPTFSVAESGMQSVKADGLHSQFNAGTQVFNFAKALEEMNATQNPQDKTPEDREARVKLYTRELLRTMITSNGTFDGNAAYAMTNNSGGASQNWDMNMATIVAPLLGDIMKHSKLGNADYMMLKSYAGGGIKSKAVEALMKYGLTEDGDTYQDSKGSWHLNANSKFAAGATENIWDWSGKKLEALQAHGFDPNNQKQMNEIVNEIGSNKSTTMMLRALLEPGTRAQMQKEINQRGLVPEGAAGILSQNDPVLKLDALHKKWDDFLTALGGPMTDVAIKALTSLAGGLNTLAQAMEAHPDATKNIGVALGAIAVGLGALAAVAFVSFVPGGAAVLGIATLASALTGLAAVNWGMFQKGGAIDAALTSFFTGIIDTLRGIPVLGKMIPGGAEAFGPPMPPHLAPGAGSGNMSDFALGATPMAYTTGANDNGSMVDMLAMGVFKGLQMYASGGGSTGGVGGGSGIINASWGGDGFGGGSGAGGALSPLMRGAGGRGGHSSGVGGGWSPSPSDPTFSGAIDASGLDWSRMGVQMGAKAAYLGDHLRGIGASEFGAAAMLGHASVESNFKVDAHNGRLEDSHGLFQWNDGVGRWSGLKRWAAANGRNPNDPLAQIDYAKVESMHMHMAGSNSPSVWDAMQHAGSLAEANRIWMDHFEAPKVRDYGNRLAAGERALGAMRSHHGMPTVDGRPTKKVSPGVPAATPGPMTTAMNQSLIHAHIYLGGKKVHHEVVKQFAQAGRFPTSGGGPDMHSHYSNAAGTPVTDAA